LPWRRRSNETLLESSSFRTPESRGRLTRFLKVLVEILELNLGLGALDIGHPQPLVRAVEPVEPIGFRPNGALQGFVPRK
jgi:hypothetical protein